MSRRDAANMATSYIVGWTSNGYRDAEVFLTRARANRFAGRLRARGAHHIWMRAW